MLPRVRDAYYHITAARGRQALFGRQGGDAVLPVGRTSRGEWSAPSAQQHLPLLIHA